MTLTTHALVGAAAASLFPEHPYLAFAAGFASHFAIDALPHYDYDEYLRSFKRDLISRLHTDMVLGKYFLRDLAIIGGDALLGFVLTFGAAKLLGISPELALVGAGAGLYPDLLQFVYYKIRTTHFGPALQYLQSFHIWVQKDNSRPGWGWQKGFAYQAVLVAIIFIVLAYRNFLIAW